MTESLTKIIKLKFDKAIDAYLSNPSHNCLKVGAANHVQR